MGGGEGGATRRLGGSWGDEGATWGLGTRWENLTEAGHMPQNFPALNEAPGFHHKQGKRPKTFRR
jgi:hypothetical protein